MRRLGNLFLLLFFMANGLALRSQNKIVLSKNDLATVLQQAKKEKKGVLFMGYASWCSHCNNMKAAVLTDSVVAAFYNKHFIAAGQDMEKDSGRQLQRYFNVHTFPTFIYLDTAGNVLYRISGEFDAKGFLEQGKAALDPEKQLPTLRHRFEADVSNGIHTLAYIMALRMGGQQTATAARRYFQTKPDDSLLTETAWRIFANGIMDITSREFRFALNHQKEFETIASPERVRRKILAATYESLSPLTLAGDSTNYFAQRKIVAGTKIYSVDSLLFTLDLDLYENTRNWERYRQASVQWADVYAASDYRLLKNMAEIYLQHISDPQGLRTAAAWAEKSLALWANYGTALVAAKLYRKLNDKTNTRRMAETAKAIAAKAGSEAAEAVKIISELQ